MMDILKHVAPLFVMFALGCYCGFLVCALLRDSEVCSRTDYDERGL